MRRGRLLSINFIRLEVMSALGQKRTFTGGPSMSAKCHSRSFHSRQVLRPHPHSRHSRAGGRSRPQQKRTRRVPASPSKYGGGTKPTIFFSTRKLKAVAFLSWPLAGGRPIQSP